MGGIEVWGFCCSKVRVPIHKVVHRSDTRAGDPQGYGWVKSRQSRPKPPSYYVTASCPHGKAYLNSFPKVSKIPEWNKHYQLSGDVTVRTQENGMKLHQSIKLHCEGNPFTVESPLKSVVSSALVPKKAEEDIPGDTEKGQKRFEEFVEDRLLPSSKHSLWDAMKKLKLKTFSNWMEKTKVHVGDKVIKLPKEW